jgi:hypothetical protein
MEHQHQRMGYSSSKFSLRSKLPYTKVSNGKGVDKSDETLFSVFQSFKADLIARTTD